VRIAKAVKRLRWGLVKALQWLLAHSFHAKLWAVRRVVLNRGKNTPGVDGIVWRSDKEKMLAATALRRRGYKPQPLRRTYIPKKNGKRRPLGIPTMHDRAQQALYLAALSPVAETTGDPNSYGFRVARSLADAHGQCFIALAKKCSPKWVFEGDIVACFDRISHEWLLQNIPMDTAVLRKWLKAGYVEEGAVHSTEEGTPQGGIISSVLANLALDGLEQTAHMAVPRRSKINVIRYADDFLITAENETLLRESVVPAVQSFLLQRGLELSEEKSKVTNIDTGFDFLGTNMRKYNDKLLIKPSKAAIRSVCLKVREVIQNAGTWSAARLIRELNPIVRGWARCWRHLVSSAAFGHVDTFIFKSLWRWARRRHPNRGALWIRRKYFRSGAQLNWLFHGSESCADGTVKHHVLFKASALHIRRHVKVPATANPYEPNDEGIFAKRRVMQKLAANRDREKWLAQTATAT
jgi:RNA-directed DNA polymerase